MQVKRERKEKTMINHLYTDEHLRRAFGLRLRYSKLAAMDYAESALGIVERAQGFIVEI